MCLKARDKYSFEYKYECESDGGLNRILYGMATFFKKNRLMLSVI